MRGPAAATVRLLGVLGFVLAAVSMCSKESAPPTQPTTPEQPPSQPQPPFQGAAAIDAGPDLRVYSGKPAEVWARITPKANPSQYHWAVAWGDGSADSGALAPNGIVAASHTYAAAG